MFRFGHFKDFLVRLKLLSGVLYLSLATPSSLVFQFGHFQKLCVSVGHFQKICVLILAIFRRFVSRFCHFQEFCVLMWLLPKFRVSVFPLSRLSCFSLVIFRRIVFRHFQEFCVFGLAVFSVLCFSLATFRCFVFRFGHFQKFNEPSLFVITAKFVITPIWSAQKSADGVFFSLTFPFYSSGKHTFCVFVRIASPRRFLQIH